MEIFTEYMQYMPHGMCLLWQPWLVILWAGSDALIFLSYMAIPFALLTVLRKRKDVPHPRLVALFASFILLCGLTHLLGIVTLWVPIYPVVGVVKLTTGLVSLATAIALFRLIPDLIALPSPAEFSSTNDRLLDEIAAHEETLASLERQVAERTSELSDLNAKLAVQAREAVHRSSNLLAVVSSLAQQSARSATDIDAYVETLVGRIRALATATSTVLQGGDKSSEQIEKVVRQQTDALLSDFPDRIVIDGPEFLIGSEAAQQIALAVHELATNAHKHGFATSDDGKLQVSWFIEQEDEDRFVFEWRETGTGVSRPPSEGGKREGFGTKLLTRVVPIMLKGEASRTAENNSYVYRLKVPVATVVADRAKHGERGFAADIVDRSFGIT